MKQVESFDAELKDQAYYAEIWHNVCKDLTHRFGEAFYKSWFSKINFCEAGSDEKIILSTPTNFIRDWIKSNYLNVICDLWAHYDLSLIHI
jgi:chromosomal replication initiator protein